MFRYQRNWYTGELFGFPEFDGRGKNGRGVTFYALIRKNNKSNKKKEKVWK
jgi:hypothetical protein